MFSQLFEETSVLTIKKTRDFFGFKKDVQFSLTFTEEKQKKNENNFDTVYCFGSGVCWTNAHPVALTNFVIVYRAVSNRCCHSPCLIKTSLLITVIKIR